MLASLFGNVLGWNQSSHANPGPIGRRVRPVLVGLSKRACVHPIYTIAFFAILASTTYLTLIESTLFNLSDGSHGSLGRIDLNYMLKGSKQLYAGPDTDWKWSVESNDVIADEVGADILAPPIDAD
jgi:hydroxymethylglutaryl-CoA reductase (NADPH)